MLDADAAYAQIDPQVFQHLSGSPTRQSSSISTYQPAEAEAIRARIGILKWFGRCYLRRVINGSGHVSTGVWQDFCYLITHSVWRSRLYPKLKPKATARRTFIREEIRQKIIQAITERTLTTGCLLRNCSQSDQLHGSITS